MRSRSRHAAYIRETHVSYRHGGMTMAELRVLPNAFDELLTPTGKARPAAAALVARLQQLGEAELRARQDLADLDILTMGITFTVYSDGVGIDRAWPFDVIPRVIDAVEWAQTEAGLIQRLVALHRFIDHIYNAQNIILHRLFPPQLPAHSRNHPTQRPWGRPRHDARAHA